MHLLSTLLLGISTNLDNLLIGVSFGFLKKRITIKANLVIGLFSAAAHAFLLLFLNIFEVWKDTKHNRRYNYNPDRSVFTDTIKGI